MTGDCHVQFSESARVKFPRATQLNYRHPLRKIKVCVGRFRDVIPRPLSVSPLLELVLQVIVFLLGGQNIVTI